MAGIIDLKAELSRLTMIDGRTPTTPEEERNKGVLRVAPYRDGAIFLARFSGKSAWERHPQGDEIVQIVDGSTTLHMITDQGRQSTTLTAGMMLVVPRNAWHQFESADGVGVMTATPQPTEHIRLDVDDPREAGRHAG
jgi:mannose-6-phosphate isomerase-like protein (cupin superfamily)